MKNIKKSNYMLILLVILLLLACGTKSEGNVTGTGQVKGTESSLVSASKEKGVQGAGTKTGSKNISGNKQGGADKGNTASTEKRFGNSTVGFVAFPEGWTEIDDSTNSPTSKAIEKNYQTIRLDVIERDIKQDIEKIHDSMLQNARVQYRLSEIEKRTNTVNGYKAKQLFIKMPDNNVVLMSFIPIGDKLYYVEVVGSEEEVKKNFELINSTWSPSEVLKN